MEYNKRKSNYVTVFKYLRFKSNMELQLALMQVPVIAALQDQI